MDMLNLLQNSDIGSYTHFEVDYNNAAVLEMQAFVEIENYRRLLEKEEEELLKNQKDSIINTQLVNFKQHRDKRRRFGFDKEGLNEKQIQEKKKLFIECEYIHNKALFDAVNESLIRFRPYGKDGEPSPWSSKKRKLKNRPPKNRLNFKKLFDSVRHDIFRWSIMQAGTLPRKDFIFSGYYDEELFNEIREKKLATVLTSEVIETEPTWLNYEFEDAQVRIDLGDMILEQLVSECIAVMNVIADTGYTKSIFTDKELVDQLIITELYYNDDSERGYMHNLDIDDIEEYVSD